MTIVRLPIEVDVERTALHARFFDRYPGVLTSQLLDLLSADSRDWRTLGADANESNAGYAGWAYWQIYLKGFVQFQQEGTAGRGNTYVDFFVEQFLEGVHDPGLRAVVPNEGAAIARVCARYTDLRRALEGSTLTGGPILVLASSRREDDLHAICDASTDGIVMARAVDGWHRLFAARLGGHATVPGQVRTDDVTWTWLA